jgi:WD40 repeat protein
MKKLAVEHIFKPHIAWVGDAAFSPDGRYLATSGGIREDLGVRLWRISDWHIVGEYICAPEIDRIEGLLFCADGSILMGERIKDGAFFVVRISPESWTSQIVIRNILCIYNVVQGHAKNQLAVHAPSLDPMVLWDGRSVSFYNMDTWKLEKTIELGPIRTSAVAFSLARSECVKAIHGKSYGPDRDDMAAVELYSDDFGNKITDLFKDSYVVGMSYSPDGSLLATACILDLLRIWDMENREEVARFSTYEHDLVPYYDQDISSALAFSPDGSLIVCAGYDNLYILRSPFN